MNATTSTLDSNGAVDKLHTGVDKLEEASRNLASKVNPLIDRGADYAHTAIDKVSETFEFKDVRDCIKAHPLKSVGAAIVLGLVVGRLL